MNRGITITNYLASGNPEGIIFSYMSNWTGQAIKIPRNLFSEVKDSAELKKPGVYFLIGQNDSNPEDKLIYVGEANNLSQRLITQLKAKENSFCEVIICFSSKDENLTVSHTKYLEEKIIDQSAHSGEYRLTNAKSGNAISLPKMVRDEMDTYYDNMKIILPTLGYNILQAEKDLVGDKDQKDDKLFLDMSNLSASGSLTTNGLMVFKESMMSPNETPSLSGSYSNMRKTLIDKGIVKRNGDKLVFTEDYEFASPSTAAALILGYSINGRIAWKYKNGQSIKDREDSQLEKEALKLEHELNQLSF
jgi:hypothetical protein